MLFIVHMIPILQFILYILICLTIGVHNFYLTGVTNLEYILYYLVSICYFGIRWGAYMAKKEVCTSIYASIKSIYHMSRIGTE
jgi:hypothetical protein